MELGDRLGIVGLILALVGLAVTILWPTKRWIGYVSLTGAGILLLWWVGIELHEHFRKVQSASNTKSSFDKSIDQNPDARDSVNAAAKPQGAAIHAAGKAKTNKQQDNSTHIGAGAHIAQTTNGDCSPAIIGGGDTVNCGPPALKISWTVAEKPSQDYNHPFYREVSVTPNIQWQPVRLKVTCSAEIKSISPYGVLFMSDGYVSQNNPKVGYVTVEAPSVAAGQALVLGVFADEPITVDNVELSNVARRRNVVEGQ